MPTGEEPPPPPRPGSHCRMLPSGMLAQLSCSGRSRGHREAAGLLPTGCRAYKHRYDHCKYPQPHQRCGRQQKVPSPQPHRASAALTPADTEQTPNGRSYAAGGGRPAAPPRTFRPRSASPTPSSPHPAAPPSTHRPLRPRAFRCPPGGCAAPVDPTESPRRPEQPGPRCSTAVGHLPLSVGKEGGGAPAEPRCRGVLCSNPRFPRTRQRRRFSRGGPIVFPPPSPAARRPRPALTCPPAPPAAARQPQPHGAPGARARQLRPGPVPAAAHGPRSAERRSSPPGMPAAGRGATTAAAPAAPPGGSGPLVFPGGDPPAARSSRVRTKPPRRRCRKSPRPSPPPPRPAASRSYDGVSCRAPLLPGVGTDPRLKASLEPGAPRRLRASSPGDGRHSLGHREHCIRVQILVIRRRRS